MKKGVHATQHSVTMMAVDLSVPAVTIVLASTPQTRTLRLGEHIQADLNGDGVNELSVTFAHVLVNRVELTLKALRKERVNSTTQTVAPMPIRASSTTALATCPSPLLTRDVQMGVSGESVRALQRYLNERGFSVAHSGIGSKGKETGYFGSMTKAALLKLQTSAHLKTSGVLDVETRAFLGCATATASLPPSSSPFVRDLSVGMVGEDVRMLQKYLNKHGFSVATRGLGAPGNESDTFGPRTRDAVKLLQTARKIVPANGYVGVTTRRSILSYP